MTSMTILAGILVIFQYLIITFSGSNG